MNKLAVSIAGLMALAVNAVPAQSHDIKIASASGLLANCSYKSKDQTEVEFHTGFCLGFIKAIMNTHPTHGETFCIPENSSNGDLINAVLDVLYELPPDMSDAPSTVIVGFALEQALPCR